MTTLDAEVPQLNPTQVLGVALSVQAGSMVMEEAQERAPAMLAHLQAMGYDVTPVAAARDPLDTAWAEVEAALPEGWRLALARSEDDFDLWEAAAVSAAFFEGENDDEIEEAVGSTPAAALRALAEALRKPVPA